MPSVATSSETEWTIRIACRTGKEAEKAGPTWAVLKAHKATSGQSGQDLLFFSDGQHDMSPDIADMSVIATVISSATTDGTTGANAKPTVKQTATTEAMSRRMRIDYHLTAA